jgi:myo-inositol-1(or 4)-monophosphatase
MQATLSDLESLARGAGDILRAGYGKSHQITHKGQVDLVTEIDKQSEDYLLGRIRVQFPGDTVLSEEIGHLEGRKEAMWFIDPLDGTTNYAHGLPLFAVSIGYAAAGQMLLGVVYDPIRDELFSAERGRGAWLNGERIQVSEVTELMQSLLVTGFPYDLLDSERNNLDNFALFSHRTQAVRRLGSAALDCCYVAAGRFDGYWELKLRAWDIAAGGLIAAEAGAVVTDAHGAPDYLKPPYDILMANPAIHAQILGVLQEKGVS